MDPDWKTLLRLADAMAPAPVNARIHVGSATDGGSQAQHFTCDDERDYIVKDPNNTQGTRVLFNDHASARFARMIGAPVPPCRLVNVPPELVAGVTFSNGKPAAGGVCHGSEWMAEVRSSVGGADHASPPENRCRATVLGVLFTILGIGDRQYLYAIKDPKLLYSVDHGFAFGGQPDWTVAGLGGTATPTAVEWIDGASMEPAVVRWIARHLRAITPRTLAAVAAGVPASWGVSDPERIAALEYLSTRLGAVITLLRA